MKTKTNAANDRRRSTGTLIMSLSGAVYQSNVSLRLIDIGLAE